MRAVPHGQTFVGGAGIEQRVAAYIGGRRTLVIVRRLALEAGRNEIPIHQVLGIMKTALVGGEQKIFSFVFHSHRVGRGTERTVGTHIVVERLEVVTDVHRIAEGARQRRLRVIPPGRLGGTADCGCLVYLFFHHYLNIGFIQCQDSVHYLFPGIVDIQVHVVLRSFDGKAAVVGSGIVHGTCEEHDCGACEWLAVGVQYVSFYDTVLGYSDVIVTDLPLHHFDGIVRGCLCRQSGKGYSTTD